MHSWHLTTNYLCGRATFKSLNVLRALRSNHRLLADKLSPGGRIVPSTLKEAAEQIVGLDCRRGGSRPKRRGILPRTSCMFSDCSHTSAPSPCLPQALPVKCTFTSILIHVPTANGCMQQHSRPYKATTVHPSIGDNPANTRKFSTMRHLFNSHHQH